MCVSSSGWAGYACLFQILRKVTHSLTEILSFASRFFFPWLNKWLRGGMSWVVCRLVHVAVCRISCERKTAGSAPGGSLPLCVTDSVSGVQWRDKNALMLGRYVCTGVWDSLAGHTQSTAWRLFIPPTRVRLRLVRLRWHSSGCSPGTWPFP